METNVFGPHGVGVCSMSALKAEEEEEEEDAADEY
jgi:hypothetical protein